MVDSRQSRDWAALEVGRKGDGMAGSSLYTTASLESIIKNNSCSNLLLGGFMSFLTDSWL